MAFLIQEVQLLPLSLDIPKPRQERRRMEIIQRGTRKRRSALEETESSCGYQALRFDKGTGHMQTVIVTLLRHTKTRPEDVEPYSGRELGQSRVLCDVWS